MGRFEKHVDREWWSGPHTGFKRIFRALVEGGEVPLNLEMTSESALLAARMERPPEELITLRREIGRQVSEQLITKGYDMPPPDGGGEFAKRLPLQPSPTPESEALQQPTLFRV